MRKLLIDKKAVARVVKYAFDNKIERETLEKMVKKEVAPVGDSPEYTCYLFDGFRVVFSIENHPMGWCRHISISVNSTVKVPSIEAAKMIMEEFGFQTPLEDCYVELEETGDPERPNAIYVIEPIKDNALEIIKDKNA